METRRLYNMDEYVDFMFSTEKNHPERVAVAKIADTGRHPLLAMTLTNKKIDDADKQNVLFTAMHSGVEYSGANTLIMLIGKLTDGSGESELFLRNFKITIIPVVNPYSYEKGGLENQYRTRFSSDPYTDPWTLEGVSDPEKNIEAAAVMEIIDKLKPELFIDCHGVFFKGQHMRENTGVSVHGMSRPHNDMFPIKLNEAAKELGYRPEYYELRQQIPTVMPGISGRKYQTCFYKLNACVYAYHNYHTLSMVMEIGFEESGLARLVRALELGLQGWPGEIVNGYPVNRVLGEGFEGIHPFSQERGKMRIERVSLWNMSDNISYGITVPQMPGTETFFILAPGDEKPGGFVLPDGSRYSFNPAKDAKLPEVPFSVSFRLPFARSELVDAKINGNPVSDDRLSVIEDDGFSTAMVGFPEGISGSVAITVNYRYALK